tara:strand:- start:3118 stop:3639 length:522 start_codon:yes stop_codon:yes gene_type:complete
MARSRISVGSSAAGATVLGANTLVERAIKHATKAAREPMEEAMRGVYAGVKRDWPRPTSSNRTGNKRRSGTAQNPESWKGFNDIGWASTGYSLKRWRWSTRVNVRNGLGTITVALTNDSTKKGARYAFMARYPYPGNRRFYWRELALKPARKQGRKLIKKMAQDMTGKMKGGR